jgi:hypothetical protein
MGVAFCSHWDGVLGCLASLANNTVHRTGARVARSVR